MAELRMRAMRASEFYYRYREAWRAEDAIQTNIRLLVYLVQLHEGRAEDEHPQGPGGLAEARPQHSQGPEVSDESHQQPEESNEHTELDPGVGGDLLSETEANFHGVFKADIGLDPLGQSCRINK